MTFSLRHGAATDPGRSGADHQPWGATSESLIEAAKSSPLAAAALAAALCLPTNEVLAPPEFCFFTAGPRTSASKKKANQERRCRHRALFPFCARPIATRSWLGWICRLRLRHRLPMRRFQYPPQWLGQRPPLHRPGKWQPLHLRYRPQLLQLMQAGRSSAVPRWRVLQGRLRESKQYLRKMQLLLLARLDPLEVKRCETRLHHLFHLLGLMSVEPHWSQGALSRWDELREDNVILPAAAEASVLWDCSQHTRFGTSSIRLALDEGVLYNFLPMNERVAVARASSLTTL